MEPYIKFLLGLDPKATAAQARAEMVEHIQKLKRLLKAGVSDPERRTTIRQMVAGFDPKDYPVVPDRSNDDKACFSVRPLLPGVLRE